MDTIGRGIAAGFVATFALSLLLDPVVMLSRTVWTPAAAFGWQLHFFAGPVIWGTGFAYFHDHVVGPSWLRGVVFVTGAGVLVMLVAVPLSGAAFPGSPLGAPTIAAILVIHVVYGALLGLVYDGLMSGDVTVSPAPGDRLQTSVR